MSLSAEDLAAQIAERNAKMEAMKAARANKGKGAKAAAAPAAAPATAAPATAAPAPAAAPPAPAPPAAPVVSAPTPPAPAAPDPPAPAPAVAVEPPPPLPMPAAPAPPAAADEEVAALRAAAAAAAAQVAELEGKLREAKEKSGRVDMLQEEVEGLRQGEVATQEKVRELEGRLASANSIAAGHTGELQEARGQTAAAQAEARKLQFEVDRLTQDKESAARRLHAAFASRAREELYLWIEHVRIEVAEADDRLALQRLCGERRVLEMTRQEGREIGERLKAAAAQHQAELDVAREELHVLEMKAEAAEATAGKHQQLAALARKQLEEHKDLHDKELNTIAVDAQRRAQEVKRVGGERDDAVAQREAAQSEAARFRREADELRARLDDARQERHDALATLSDEREDRVRALRSLKDQLTKREAEREALMQKLPEHDRERAQLEERIRALEVVRRENEAEMRTLRQDREAAEAKVCEIRAQFREKQKGDELEILRLLRNDRNWRGERAEMEEEIKRLSDDVNSKTRDSLHLHRELDQMSKRTQKARMKQKAMQIETYQMADRLKTLAREGSAARHVMTNEVAGARSMHMTAAHSLEEEAVRMREEWMEKVQRQEADLIRANETIDEKNKKIASLRAKLTDLKEVNRYAVGLSATPTKAAAPRPSQSQPSLMPTFADISVTSPPAKAGGAAGSSTLEAHQEPRAPLDKSVSMARSTGARPKVAPDGLSVSLLDAGHTAGRPAEGDASMSHAQQQTHGTIPVPRWSSAQRMNASGETVPHALSHAVDDETLDVYMRGPLRGELQPPAAAAQAPVPPMAAAPPTGPPVGGYSAPRSAGGLEPPTHATPELSRVQYTLPSDPPRGRGPVPVPAYPTPASHASQPPVAHASLHGPFGAPPPSMSNTRAVSPTRATQSVYDTR